ncbi:MAG: hypothetical protein ACPGPS_07995 [Rubripirellula sp.]
MTAQSHRATLNVGCWVLISVWIPPDSRDTSLEETIVYPQRDLNTGGEAMDVSQKDRMKKRPHDDAEVTSWTEQPTRLKFSLIGDR